MLITINKLVSMHFYTNCALMWPFTLPVFKLSISQYIASKLCVCSFMIVFISGLI